MANLPMKNLLTLIQKRLLSTAATISTSPLQQSSSLSFTVQFLINSCGLSRESALSISQKLKFDENNFQKPQSVLNFLKSNGFDDTHIVKLVEKHPSILHCRVEKNLKPKWEYLGRNGYKGTVLTEFLISNPNIMRISLYDKIKPLFVFLKELLGSNDNVAKTIKRASWLLTIDLKKNLKPNVDFLIKGGVPVSNISKLLLWQPRSLIQKPDDFVRDFNAIKEFGLDPTAPIFVHALRVMLQMSESTLKKKMEVFKSLGWTKEEILSTFKQNPSCFACSEERIRSKMDYLVNTMKLEPEFVIAHPVLLGYAIHRMRMRCKILKVLESKKLLEWNNRVAWSVTLSEDKFFRNYVDKYKKNIPDLLEMYKNTAKAEKLDI